MLTRIAVDAMGGDHAPAHSVGGALAAARHLGLAIDLVGPAGTVQAELNRHADAPSLDVRVIDAPEAIGMEEAPAQALCRKPRASIRVAAGAVATGDSARWSAPGTRGPR